MNPQPTLRRAVVALSLIPMLLLAIPIGAGADPAPPNPTTNITPSPDFLSSGPCTGLSGSYSCTNPCVTNTLAWPAYSNDPACTVYVLSAIEAARAQLAEPPLVLPSNWYTLTPPQQLFVIINLERVGLGYPPYLGLNTDLTAAAQAAAAQGANTAVTPPPGFAVGNNANGVGAVAVAGSSGFSALAADYFWMYADGWGGSSAATTNAACTSATAPGCWQHRVALLGGSPDGVQGVGLSCTTCEMGTGYATASVGPTGSGSSGASSVWVALIEMPASSPPGMTFTWASEVPFLSPGLSTTTTTTTTTLPHPTPSPVIATKWSFSTSRARVRWVSPGTTKIIHATLITYRGAACKTRYRSGGISVSPTKNSPAGSLALTGTHLFFPPAVYSARVQITNTSGSRLSNCVRLGRS